MKASPLRLRSLLLSALVLALLAVLGLEFAGWPFFRHSLERQLTRQLQRQVQLQGDFRLRLLGNIRLRVERLTIDPPDWEKSAAGAAVPAFLDARTARLVLPYRSVIGRLRGDSEALRIRLLEVESVEARLVRREDGRANWHFEQKPTPGGAPTFATPEFVHLIVHKGELTLRDEVKDIKLKAQARTREGIARDASGLFVRASGTYRGQDFTAEARSPGLLPLVAPGARTTAAPLSLSARLVAHGQRGSELRFRGKARDLLRFEGLDGQFRLSGPSLAEVGSALHLTLPSTAPFFMQGRVEKQDELWRADVTRFEVGQTRLHGRFRYDRALMPPLLSGELRGAQLLLKDLAPAFGAPPATADDSAATNAAAKAGGNRPRQLLPQREFNIPALRRMEANVDVRIARVDLGSEKLQAMEPLQGHLTLHKGVLRLERLLTRTAQGQLEGWLQVDGTADTPLWSGDLRWSGIQLANWIRQRNRFFRDDSSPAAASKESPPDTHFVTGELAGQARFEGRGRSTAAMLGSLDGQVHAWVRDGSVSHLLMEALGLDVAESLGLIIRGDRNLPLQCAAMSMKARQGVLHTEAGVVDTPDTLLVLGGNISLADETFRLRLEARPHDRSLFSLRSPLELRGHFSAPRISPELRQVGRKAVLATVLGSLLTPLAALVPLVDPGESAGNAGCAATLARLKQKPGTPAAMKRALGNSP